MNRLYFGDNLQILRRHIKDESVDLVYLDPPFNSNRSYNVLFKSKSGDDAQAQIEAFDDTWSWSQDAEEQYEELATGPNAKVADAVIAMRRLLGDNDVLAYLVMMAARLVELHRVLKPTGSLYLHCDPTASHYLKVILDAIFGLPNFRNEIAWKRFSGKNDPKRFGRSHDVIFFYTKTKDCTWNVQHGPFEPDYVQSNYRYVEESTGRRYRLGDLTAAKPGGDVDFEWHGAKPYKGRHWAYSRKNMDRMLEEGRIVFRRTGMPVFKRYLDEQPGVPLQDIWTDIRLHAGSHERLGYPTQKPLALLERIVQASTNPGEVVLDPFCGCGTTIDAAQKLGRQWIGIDITVLAIDLIQRRLEDTYGEDVRSTYELAGVPREIEAAQALFRKNPFEFERWAVMLAGGIPNERQVGDRGIDGRIRFHLDKNEIGEALVSVKGGAQLNPSMVRDLRGTVERQKAEMGVFICLGKPTKGMIEEAAHSGSFHYELSGARFPRIQIVTIADLLAGKRPDMPTPIRTTKRARKRDSTPELDFG